MNPIATLFLPVTSSARLLMISPGASVDHLHGASHTQ